MRAGRPGGSTAGGLVALLGALLITGSPAVRPSGRQAVSPEDRVLVSDFSHVTALAASSFFVYAATPHALLIYDRAARRWELPVTDGYPRGVITALADAEIEGVWLSNGSGWKRYDPRIRQWQVAVAPQRTVPPLDPETALARAPQADALRALILTDPQLRTYQFTSAAATPDQPDLYFGTTGLGVVRFEGFGARWEALTYGLPAARALSLAPAADGIWVGVEAREARRAALGFLSSDLSMSRWLGGAGTRGLGFQTAYRVLAAGKFLWIAAEQSVTRVNPATEQAISIPVERPITVSRGRGGVWIGQNRGWAFVSDSGEVVTNVNGPSVLSLLETDSVLWFGTAVGLLVATPPQSEPTVPAEVSAVPALKTVIMSVARLGDTIVAATQDQVAWRDPTTARWSILRPPGLGQIFQLVPDRDGVWVCGQFGIAFWRLRAGTFRSVPAPLAYPGPVYDALVARPYLWIATDSGVVRLRREAVIR